MVKLKNNIEYIEYIKNKMLSIFNNITILDYYTEQTDGRFGIYFLYDTNKILISSSRGYLGLDIYSKENLIEVNRLDENINNLFLSVDSIDYYIDFLRLYFEQSGQA